jgi:hypothetical protein
VAWQCAQAGAIFAYLLTDRALGTGGGHFESIDSAYRRQK